MLGISLLPSIQTYAANPYLPLWERIPDGEPKVFTHEGEERVYIYGSHDSTNDKNYCGYDHVVWSAPTDDLNNWRHDGVAFDVKSLEGVPYTTYDNDGNVNLERSGTIQPNENRMLYAPDAVYNPVLDKYYLYMFIIGGSPEPPLLLFVASSDSPAGPFTDPVHIPVGFGKYGSGGGMDPGVLVDMDNLDDYGYPTVYLYWGFMRQGACKLDGSDMSTIIEGSVKSANVSGVGNIVWGSGDPSGVSVSTPYYEASSPRKIGDYYVLVYASYNADGNGESSLSYVYSTEPIGFGETWSYGGVISDNRGEIIKNPYDSSEDIWSYQISNGRNNHGGLAEINGQWYIFYHRHTVPGRAARQAMVEPVNISTVDGKLVIEQTEVTSQGFETNGLDPYKEQDAGILSYAIGSNIGVQTHTYDIEDWDPNSTNPNMDWNPVSNIENRNWIGYKYFNFGEGIAEDERLRVSLTLTESLAGTVNIYAAEPRVNNAAPEQPKTLIGSMALNGDNADLHTVEATVDSLKERKAIYFEFLSEEGGEICQVNKLQFFKTSITALVEEIESGDYKKYDYTRLSWSIYQDALDAALKIAKDKDAAQLTIDKALNDLIAAKEGLKKKPEAEKTDKSLLDEVIQKANYKEKDYTAKSWADYKTALDNAQTISDKANATQAEVDGAEKELRDAINALVRTPMRYTDVIKGEWYYNHVEYVHNNLLMTGLNDTLFGTNEPLARAQVAVILYRMEGEPKVSNTNKFSDVILGEWYTDAVTWANEAGIVTGYSDTGKFVPGGNISRQELATMIYRYADYKGMDIAQKASITRFADHTLVAPYALEPMKWAVRNDIISGKDNQTKLDPLGTATRAECATIIHRFLTDNH